MAALPDTLCYLNGAYTPLNEAKVSVMDRGFIFGDGIYEVVPVYGRRLFRFDAHLARLERSLAKMRIANPFTRAQWLERVRPLVAAVFDKTAAQDQLVYIQITRGVAPRDHVMPEGLEPTVFMMANPMKPVSPEQRHQGVACVTARDFRWERGDIKSTSLLGNVFARQISADAGAVETIMFREGFLTEAAASNVWIVKEGALLGVPKTSHVLEGIRFDLLRELCERRSPRWMAKAWATAPCAAARGRYTPAFTRPISRPRPSSASDLHLIGRAHRLPAGAPPCATFRPSKA